MHRNRSLVDLGALPELFPHRVVRAAELVALGITSTTVQTNTRPGGPWQRLLPGILLLSNAPPTRRQLIQAALRYAGPNAVLTGHDALQLHGMRAAQPGGPVHVLVPHDRNVRFADGVAVERTLRLPSPLLRDEFPVAPLERAVLDTARRLGTVGPVRAIIAEAVQRGVNPARLLAELDIGSRRGGVLVRQVLTEITDRIRSMAAGLARRLLLGSHLPAPTWNVPICDADGQLVAVVDAWWDDVALAWAIDPAPETCARLTAAGITVVHTAPARLRQEPAAVVRQLEQALAHAQGRPRPRILAG